MDDLWLTRSGIILEMVSLLLIAPEVLGEERLTAWQRSLRSFYSEWSQKWTRLAIFLIPLTMVGYYVAVIAIFWDTATRAWPFTVMLGVCLLGLQALTIRARLREKPTGCLSRIGLFFDSTYTFSLLALVFVAILWIPVAIAARTELRILVFWLGATLLLSGLALQLGATF